MPKNVREVRKFLGLANYYRKFIRDFAKIERPMNILTRKNVKIAVEGGAKTSI